MVQRQRQWRGEVIGIVAVALLALLSAGAIARGEDGIVVAGAGEATAKPTQLVMATSLNAEAELASDALVKFRDAKKRALAALDALKNPDLKVESGGVAVNSAIDAAAAQMLMRGQAVNNPQSRTQVAETEKVVLDGIDKLDSDTLIETVLKLIDTARDAGLSVGGPAPTTYYEMQSRMQNSSSLLQFRLPDARALREQAYKAALDDARARAEKLAALSGLKLVRIASIQEAGTDSQAPGRPYYNPYAMSTGEADSSSLSTNTFSDVTAKVNLIVRFEISK